MTLARLDEVIGWDSDGNVDGLQFDSRARRIQEWRDKKEDAEFCALVERLQKRNAARRAAADPVKRERMREANRRHQASGRKEARARQRRREQYEANPTVNVCEQCGAKQLVPFDKKGTRPSRFCSKKCRNAWHGKRRQRAKGLRTMNIKAKLMHVLRKGPVTSLEATEAVGGKYQSVKALLCRWAKAGEIISDGGKPAKYSISH